MLWSISGGVIIFVLGMFIFLKPDLVWKLTEAWKSYRADEPSELYLKTTKNWRYFICSIRSCYDNTSLYFEIITFRLHDERQINFRRDIDTGYRDYNDCICSDYNLFVL